MNNEITRAFLLVELDNSGELRQVYLSKEQSEVLKLMLLGGIFCEEIKISPDITAKIDKKD